MTDYDVYFKISGEGCSGLSWEYRKDKEIASLGGVRSWSCSFFYRSIDEAIQKMLSEIEAGISEGDTIRFVQGWCPWSAPTEYKQHYEKFLLKYREFIEEGPCEGDLKRMGEKVRLQEERARLERILVPYFPEDAEEIEEKVLEVIRKFAKEKDYITLGEKLMKKH